MASPAPSVTRDARGGGGPDVAPTAAPGVAFNFAYAFRLEAERIAQVQERHARACEELGVARCRISGMRYRLVDERDVEASLEFRLEPGIARRFGQAGLEAVRQAEGILVESAISGTDVGTGIARDTRGIEQLNADLARIEAQLADPQVRADGKDTLRYEAEQIRARIRALQETRQDAQDSLATTPMTFEYGSGSYGSDRPDFRAGAANAWDGFLWGLYGLMVTLTVLLPWFVALGLLWAAIRAVRRRWPRRGAAGQVEPADPAAIGEIAR